MGKRDEIGERIKRAYNHYDEKIKQEVINAYVYGKEGIYKLGRKYGIKPHTIYLWLMLANKTKKYEPPKPFNFMISISRGGKVKDLKECADIETANSIRDEYIQKGYEVDISELK